MGKAAKLKKIRKIASQLPVIERAHIQGERVSGVDLIESGKTDSDGKAILPNMFYRKKTVVPVAINHDKAMKRNYNLYGMRGVMGYAQAVINHCKKKQAAPVQP